MRIRSYWTTAVACVLLTGWGCQQADEGDRPFLTRSFQTAEGHTANCVLFVPPNRDPNTKLPVILFLNGWGENGNDGLRQISNNFGGDMWRMRGWFPFLAVCPQCSYNAEWTPGSPNEQIALGVLDEAIREFNGDPDCVAITGASTGGKGALEIALANRHRFTAVIPIAAPIHVRPDELAESRLAIWSFYNNGDSPGLVRAARATRKRHLEAGTSPLVTEFNLSGHNAWDPAYSSPALYRWLLQQRRTPLEPPVRFQLLTPEKVLTQWTAEGPDWMADGDDVVCPAGSSTRRLTSPPLTGDWAIHFDLQVAEGLSAVVKLKGEQDKELELHFPLNRDGIARMTLPDSSRVVIDPAAQRALRPGWNDFRFELVGGRWSLVLNGWPAVEEMPHGLAGPVRIALENVSPDKEQRIRFLRSCQIGRGVLPE